MAKRLSKSGIRDGVLARAYHVTQSIDALTGVDDYDIVISGSLTLTGSTNINGLVTATSFSGDGSSITGVTGEWDGTLNGNAIITGSLLLTQNLTASNVSSSGDIIGNNINATGNITGNNLSGTNTGDQNISNLAVTGSSVIFANITSSGHISASGDLSIEGFSSVSASLASAGQSGVTFPYTGSAIISGSLEVEGLTNILASEASNLTLEINESASFEFLTGAPNTGSFIVQTSPDTGKGALQSYFGQGTGTVFSQPIPNQAFGITYTSGSGASEGELTMVIGKRDLSGVGAANQNNFYVSYEPAGIFTNAQGELEFYVGEHANVGTGVLSVFRGGASGATTTSSFAGYFSSSAFPNQQQYTRPFAISATSTVNNSNPAFVINKDVTDLTTSNFSVDYGGNVSASGNGIFKAGKPITTHTSSPISASYANAGGYHIVGGNLTASIVLDSTAPVGAEYEFFQTSSTGQFLFESASGTTVISKNGSMRLAQQGSSAVLKKVSTTTFHLMGDLT